MTSLAWVGTFERIHAHQGNRLIIGRNVSKIYGQQYRLVNRNREENLNKIHQ